MEAQDGMYIVGSDSETGGARSFPLFIFYRIRKQMKNIV